MLFRKGDSVFAIGTGVIVIFGSMIALLVSLVILSIVLAVVQGESMYFIAVIILVMGAVFMIIFTLEMAQIITIIDGNTLEITCYRFVNDINIRDIERVEDKILNTGKRVLMIHAKDSFVFYNRKRNKIKKMIKTYNIPYSEKVSTMLHKIIPQDIWFVVD